ncbi:MAG: DNA mismatch repair protein MutS [Elusimicrobia bacterium]|nr:DNA mismatch repair protein MutS [Elusimicrobiota bacterium]
MIDTPLMRQYQALKASYPHAILFFRLGDFYEMFGDDAKTASPILGLLLTARQAIPMCGVPAHSASNYIAKLLKAGHKVAVAEQMEDPSQVKGLVRRQVIRLVTPGTVVEDELLEAVAANYLVSLELDWVGWGLACMEISTGEFWATQVLNDLGHRQLFSLLARLDPAEIVVSKQDADTLRLKTAVGPKTALSFLDFSKAPNAGSNERPSWTGSPPWHNRHLAARAALAVGRYVVETQSHLSDLLTPSYREIQEEMLLDEAAIRTLELVGSSTGQRRHSLWGLLDHCRTSMGSRRLRSWILHPLLDIGEIERRQNTVEELLDRAQSRKVLAQIFGEIADIERVVSRLGTRAASPRDLAALRNSLLQTDAFRSWLCEAGPASALSSYQPVLEGLAQPLEDVRHLLERSLADRPPQRLSDGGIIRPGYDTRLDELMSIKNDGQKYIETLEEQERRSTGIGSLKIGYNSVFGYYIEVTRPHLSKVPQRFTRKQTLANAERFITPELKELEVKMLGAQDKAVRLEAELFDEVRRRALQAHRALLRFAALLAEIDALSSFAETAFLHEYVKPRVDLSHELTIEEGRHPMVECTLPAGAFVPNSLSLNGPDPQVLILTGPNMGGKSTFLRQNALIALMAQIGSFVPAKTATVGIVDKILTRIGSQDALSRNESTFMVEMRETAHILSSATLRSLLILDEVGRGTSTFDGISIAWAVIEHLSAAYRTAREGAPAEASPRGPRVLFATHYFELTELAELLPGVRNANVEAREWTDAEGRTEVVFLHKIATGPADRSFGIHVAQLAGLPAACLNRAREILSGLENKSRAMPKGSPLPNAPLGTEPALPLFEDHPVLREIRLLHPDEITPLTALERIHRWKKGL